MTSRLHTLRMAAKPNAVAMPWVIMCCDWASGCQACQRVAGRMPVRGAVHRHQHAEAQGAAHQLEHVHQADAAPESAAGTPASDAVVSGTNTSPMPRPISSIGPKMPDQ